MKRNSLIKSLSVLTLTLILGACSSSNEVASGRIITKRKVNSGYHINWPSNWKNNHEELAEQKIKQEKNKVELVESNQTIEIVEGQQTIQTEFNSTDEATQNEVDLAIITEEKIVSEPKEKLLEKTNTSDKKQAKEVKQTFKKMDKRHLKQKHQDTDISTIALYVIAIFIPFLAVGIVTDWNLTLVLINIILCCFFWVPGIIHAIIVVRNNS